MSAPTRVAFLGGMGRSGSTLLERMLADLPGVQALGEVTHLWERALRDDERCGCGQAFSQCPFWSEVGQRAFGGWDRLDVGNVLQLKGRADRTRHVPRLGLPVLLPSARSDLARYLDLYERVYAAAAAVSGATVVVDSSKHASLAYCLRWSRRLDLRVLHVVRDSPAVAYSWTKEVARPEVTAPSGGRPDHDLMPRYSTARVIARWNVDNALFGLLGRAGVPVQVLRYEDLVADPGPTLARAADFLGLPPGTRGSLDGHRLQMHADHTVAGNPMRFTTGELVLRRDDAWRTRYPRRRQVVVRALTSPLRARFGYRSRDAAPCPPRPAPPPPWKATDELPPHAERPRRAGRHLARRVGGRADPVAPRAAAGHARRRRRPGLRRAGRGGRRVRPERARPGARERRPAPPGPGRPQRPHARARRRPQLRHRRLHRHLRRVLRRRRPLAPGQAADPGGRPARRPRGGAGHLRHPHPATRARRSTGRWTGGG